MSGGGQHNPNGRQAQLGSAWNHLQVPYMGRLPQAAHMSSERAPGVTWHTPTPPPHAYHPPPVSPDPLQGLKVGGAGGNALFRHTPTPPDRDALLYRHSPTPPDKLYRHTPSPGDAKAGASLPPADIYPIPLPRDKLRPEELLGYARGGVDLTLSRPANGAPLSLSVRDAPTINSLVTMATRAPRPAHARVDALLERLTPQPHSPHSVIVHARTAPSPPDSNEDSADSCGAPPGSKRKRKPERTIKVPVSPAAPPQTCTPPPRVPSPPKVNPSPPRAAQEVPSAVISRIAAIGTQETTKTVENGSIHENATNGPKLPHARRKTKSDSGETIDDIAAMIASDKTEDMELTPVKCSPQQEATATIEVLKSVLGSPDPKNEPLQSVDNPCPTPKKEKSPVKNDSQSTVSNDAVKPEKEPAKLPKRRSTRSSKSDVSSSQENTSESKPIQPEIEPSDAASENKKEDQPTIVDVENQLEQMFAGIEEPPKSDTVKEKAKKRRKSRGNRKAVKGKDLKPNAVSSADGVVSKKKAIRKKPATVKGKKREVISHKDAYDSGSNASSGRSRGPYVQIKGPRDSPLSVSVINATTGEDDCEASTRARPSRRKGSEGEFRNGLKSRGLHCSTLGVRYDATTPDATWVCAFCELGPHASVKERLEGPVRPLGDLFGPYAISTACEEYRALDESQRHWTPGGSDGKETREVWFHEECGLWAPGLLAAGARLSGLQEAVWGARGAVCGRCGRAGAAVACAHRACPARAHINCARTTIWRLDEDDFRALCPRHAV